MEAITVQLDDGTPASIREISDADRERLAEGYRMLSPEARYHRFWTKVGELGDGMLDRLVKADQYDHVVWGATDPDHLDTPGMGAASYWRSKLDHEEATAYALTNPDRIPLWSLRTIGSDAKFESLDEAVQWVESFEEGASFDHAASGAIHYLRAQNTATAISVAERIRDPQLRTDALENLGTTNLR